MFFVRVFIVIFDGHIFSFFLSLASIFLLLFFMYFSSPPPFLSSSYLEEIIIIIITIGMGIANKKKLTHFVT